ncbi:hypothetical protein MM239_17370 [Belliella sp. DSM 111904]|uniref:TIGR04255 family protein n=1 Tax=Belliella filtrata TaxID=2923435 RepID=A0ABS9V426_9BACT|nr:hypothetical protein [Belliella filtrata]MCH7411172.1 hypothetical protein [Belliella filtrata]
MISSIQMNINKLDFLLHHGFTLDPENLNYVKTMPVGRQIVFLNFIQNANADYLECLIGIRIREVEEIVNLFLPSLGDFSERSTTAVISLNELNRSLPRRFFIHDNDDIKLALAEYEKVIKTVGLEWFEKFSQPSNMEMLFNQNPDQEFTTQNFTYRSSRAMILSKLYNPESYEVNKNHYLNKLDEMMLTPFILASFLNLLDYLETTIR